jgi:hypothetical protein
VYDKDEIFTVSALVSVSIDICVANSSFETHICDPSMEKPDSINKQIENPLDYRYAVRNPAEKRQLLTEE